MHTDYGYCNTFATKRIDLLNTTTRFCGGSQRLTSRPHCSRVCPRHAAIEARRGVFACYALTRGEGCLLMETPFSARDGQSYCSRVCPRHAAIEARRGVFACYALTRGEGCLLMETPFSARDGQSYCSRVCPRHAAIEARRGVFACYALTRGEGCLLMETPFSARDGQSYCSPRRTELLEQSLVDNLFHFFGDLDFRVFQRDVFVVAQLLGFRDQSTKLLVGE